MKKILLLMLIILLPIKIYATVDSSYNDTKLSYVIPTEVPDRPEVGEDEIPSAGHWEHVPEKLSFCEREDTSKIVRLVDRIIKVLRIVVPLLLLFSLIFELVKAISNAEKLEKYKKKVILKCSIAALIFLIPTIVSLITNIAGFKVNYSECIEMAEHPKEVYFWVDDTLDYERTGIYIKITEDNVKGIYFSDKKENASTLNNSWILTDNKLIDFILLPGEHYIYVKTKDGILEEKITIQPSDIIVTNDVKDIEFLHTDLDKYLLEHGSSLEEFNNAIARSVYIAGGSTKEGAAAAALALTQILYVKYKIKIPYGNTHGNHIVMGAPSNWGSPNVTSLEKEGHFDYQGIHCGGFVAWAYAQANFDMNPSIGSSEQFCMWRYATINGIDYKNRGAVGDAITYAIACENDLHVAIISAIDSNGYYVTEANAWTGTINGVRTKIEDIGIVTTYNKIGDRWRSYLDMDLTLQFKKKKTDLKSGF